MLPRNKSLTTKTTSWAKNDEASMNDFLVLADCEQQSTHNRSKTKKEELYEA